MAASPNLLPWFETARIAAKCTQAAPAMARPLTMRPSVLSSCQIIKIERLTVSQDDGDRSQSGNVLTARCPALTGSNLHHRAVLGNLDRGGLHLVEMLKHP